MIITRARIGCFHPNYLTFTYLTISKEMKPMCDKSKVNLFIQYITIDRSKFTHSREVFKKLLSLY